MSGSIAAVISSIAALIAGQSDNFNRATLDANWLQTNPSWGNVVIQTSSVIVASAANTNNEAIAAWVGPGTPTNNHVSEITIGGLSFLSIEYAIGVAVRVSTDTDAARDCYFASVSADSSGPNYTTVLGKVVNGTRTVLHSAAIAWANGDVIGLSCSGTTISVRKNGSDIGGSFTQTDTDLSTGTWGILANGPVVTGDNWQGYSI